MDPDALAQHVEALIAREVPQLAGGPSDDERSRRLVRYLMRILGGSVLTSAQASFPSAGEPSAPPMEPSLSGGQYPNVCIALLNRLHLGVGRPGACGWPTTHATIARMGEQIHRFRGS